MPHKYHGCFFQLGLYKSGFAHSPRRATRCYVASVSFSPAGSLSISLLSPLEIYFLKKKGHWSGRASSAGVLLIFAATEAQCQDPVNPWGGGGRGGSFTFLIPSLPLRDQLNVSTKRPFSHLQVGYPVVQGTSELRVTHGRCGHCWFASRLDWVSAFTVYGMWSWNQV